MAVRLSSWDSRSCVVTMPAEVLGEMDREARKRPAARGHALAALCAALLGVPLLAGPSQGDLARAFLVPPPRPRPTLPVEYRLEHVERLRLIGVDVRPLERSELLARLGGAAVYDDYSPSAEKPRVAEPRLHADAVEHALRLFRRIFGPQYVNADNIRAQFQSALDDYRREIGPGRVIGFEFRRYLMNRPSSQAKAYQWLRDLEPLFRSHRNSGLSAGEYRRIQREWLLEILPEGISVDEFAELIHPSRYVRGTDVLDIFGD